MTPTITIDRILVKWFVDETDVDTEACQAIAEVSYALDRLGNRRLEQLTSGGLYGIERPSNEYRKHVEAEELDELREHLKAFNVDVTTFDDEARNAKGRTR